MISRRTFLALSLAWPFTVPGVEVRHLLRTAEKKDGQREEMLTKGRPTDVESLAEAIVIKHENMFFLAKPDGNVPLHNRHGFGLYYHDCRFLNGYELRLSGLMAQELSASAAQGSIGVFTLTNPRIRTPDGSALDKEEIGITWDRLIDSGTPALRDWLLFQNFTLRHVAFSASLTFQSAFEDVFAVRGLVQKRYGDLHAPVWNDGALIFRYDGKDRIYRSLAVHCSPQPYRTHGATAEFLIRLGPRESRQIAVSLILTESRGRPAILPTVAISSRNWRRRRRPGWHR